MSKKCIRISVILLLLIISPRMPFICFAAQNAEDETKLTIIHINDKHGRMGAEPYISELARQTVGNVLILDAGDTLHGQTAANLSKGESMVELMNEVGYSAMTAGNHDFSYGAERLSELSEMMNFPLLTANVKMSDGRSLFQSYKVFPMDGVTVGVFGITTPETVNLSDPRMMTGLTFEDPVKTAEEMVKALKDEGCDIIIALAHMGIDDISAQDSRSNALAYVVGIDIIIDGHSHAKWSDGLSVQDTLIAQTGEYGQNIGIVEVTMSGAETVKTARLIAVPENGETSELAADEHISSKIAELEAANESLTSAVVGHTPVFLQGEKEIVRTQETNLANLITDSFRYATGADIAFLTGGNIRESISAGNISMGQVLNTMPYSNLLVTLELTGAELLAVLEHGVSLYPKPAGQYIQVSGISFEFDPDAEPMYRVTKVTVADGGLFDVNKVYTVATIDFIAAGGDGYSMLLNNTELVYCGYDAGALVDYLATGPDIKEVPEGRVKAINASDNQAATGEAETINPEAENNLSVIWIIFAGISAAIILFIVVKRIKALK